MQNFTLNIVSVHIPLKLCVSRAKQIISKSAIVTDYENRKQPIDLLK